MSCDTPLAAAASLFLASWQGDASLMHRTAFAEAPAPVASEPLFVDIVSRAGKLKDRIEAFRAKAPSASDLSGFKSDVTALAALDEKGHDILMVRDKDGDLKCILHGIAQDLPRKLADMMAANDAKARDNALKEMSYLLRDNVEVITTPASVVSGKEG